jgi:hypothetical protein
LSTAEVSGDPAAVGVVSAIAGSYRSDTDGSRTVVDPDPGMLHDRQKKIENEHVRLKLKLRVPPASGPGSTTEAAEAPADAPEMTVGAAFAGEARVCGITSFTELKFTP